MLFYLSIYAGQQILCKHPNGEQVRYKFVGIQPMDNNSATIYTDSAYFCLDIKSIQLRLRPISDLTDTEAEILGWYNNGSISKEQFINNRVIENKFEPSEFEFLIKEGVDLFNLIDKGLAIDKTI